MSDTLMRFVFEPAAQKFLTEKGVINASYVDFVWPGIAPMPIQGDVLELPIFGGIALRLINRYFVVTENPPAFHIHALMDLTLMSSRLPTGKPSVVALRNPKSPTKGNE